jgi:hypothetical protein
VDPGRHATRPSDTNCGGGLTEDQDVTAAVEYAFARDTGGAPRVGVVGFGLDAATALAAVGRFKGGTETMWVFSGDSEGGSDWMKIPPATIKRLSFVVAVQPVSVGTLLRGRFVVDGWATGRLTDWH